MSWQQHNWRGCLGAGRQRSRCPTAPLTLRRMHWVRLADLQDGYVPVLCIYVCVHVCMYVCMYVGGWVGGWVGGYVLVLLNWRVT